ncbi:MAG: DUF7948 domain-containing protein, partial [Candidatus Thorarchaeota archaeon]
MRRTHTIVGLFIIVMICSSFFMDMTTHRDPTHQLNSQEFEDLIYSQIDEALLGYFYENVGQLVDPDILFLGRISSGLVGFAKNSIVILNTTEGSSITLSFETEQEVVPQGRDESKHITNFIQGTDVRLTGVRGFSHLVYNEVWPGIDIHCATDNTGITISFELAVDSDSDDIRIKT